MKLFILLSWWNPFSWPGDAAAAIGDAIRDLWYWIWISLNDMIYSLINLLYRVFDAVSNANLFDRETFGKITDRMYIVLAIAMLFIFAYNIILMIINPEDKKGTGQATKLVKETIISLTLIILLPTIFDYMYRFQKNVIRSNIISNIVLGESTGNTDDCDYNSNSFLLSHTSNEEVFKMIQRMYSETVNVSEYTYASLLTPACEGYMNDVSPAERGANIVGVNILNAFYHPTKFTYYECKEFIDSCNGGSCYSSVITSEDDKNLCGEYFYSFNMAKYTGNVSAFLNNSTFVESAKSGDGKVEFHYFLAFAAGLFGAWMFICYGIEMGVRVAKLGFLQIVSPIAVIMRAIPKQKEAFFDKWFKQLLNTYTDIFIRLIIINFVLFAITLIPDLIYNLAISTDDNLLVWLFAEVAIILGILKFGQECPKLLKEFFGDSGRFALKSPKKQLQENKAAMGALGAIGGAVSTGVKNKGKGSVIAGAGSGLIRGAMAGYKSQNFKDLKYNTSAAVDRALQARDKRDIRQEYDRKNGFQAYRKSSLKDSLEKWTSGDSFASLTNKKQLLQGLEGNYNKAIADVEKALEEKATKFKYDGKSYYEYQQMRERAAREYQDFDRQKYEEAYMKSNKGATIAMARNESQNEMERLLKAANNQTALLADVKKNLTDAILQVDSNFSDVKSFVDKNGDRHSIEVGDDMAGLKETIEKANNAFEKSSGDLSNAINSTLSSNSKSIREKRNSLRNEMSTIDARIEQLTELKKSDKNK